MHTNSFLCKHKTVCMRMALNSYQTEYVATFPDKGVGVVARFDKNKLDVRENLR